MENLLIIGCGDVARRALPELQRRYRVTVCLARSRRADAAPCYHGDSCTLRLPNRRMKAELGA
ncbi:MAG: hypothetical protein E6H70_12755 [Betaproteobacteria bacterium]|nr:MAG: hypothetical protein E6H70_12755 [Betaproteobacteria bacterium]